MSNPPSQPYEPYPSAPPAAPRPGAPGSALAVTALVLGVLPVLLDVVRLVVSASLIGGYDPLLDLVNVSMLVLAGILAIAGVVLAILALRSPTGSRVLAGIALGLNLAALWAVALSAVYPALFGLIAGF